MPKLNHAKNYSSLNFRLSEVMRKKKYNIPLLSKESGVAIGTIQKLMTDHTCNPTLASLEAICNVLDISISQLIGESKTDTVKNKSAIPIFLWEELPHLIGVKKSLHPFQGSANHETITTSRKVSPESFAIKMSGNSMLPLFPAETLLIFDKEKPIYDNCYILAKLENHNVFVFKQLLIDEPHKYIKSINPTFKDKLVKLETKDKIIATLIEAQIQYK
jgi:DNA-binding Xre family transcriptional regulator